MLALIRLLVAGIWLNEPTTSYPSQVAQYLDPSVNPCEDFYKFACGGYSRLSVPEPSASADMRYALDQVQANNRQVLLTLLQSNTPVVSKYFDACMNTTRINELGSKPLQPVLAKIDAAQNLEELFRAAGELTLVHFDFLVKVLVSSDNTRNVLHLTRASLPIQNRMYYWVDKFFASILPQYRQYISTLLTQAQVADPATVNTLVDTIVQLEKRIADIKWTHTIDPSDSYVPMTFAAASKKYPITVKEVVTGMFAKAGLSIPDGSHPLIIRTPPYLVELERLLPLTKLSEWKTLMKYQYIHARNDLLDDPITTAAFEFHGQSIRGVSERPTREKFCVDLVLQQLPNRMGKEYAALMFDAESATVAKDMFSRIEVTMKQHLTQTDWFDRSTRKKALEKLSKVVKMIGYSDEVEPVNDATLSAGDLFENTESIQRSQALQQLQKLSKPVHRGEWRSGATVEMIYNLLNQNSIVIPAGILQPPYFNKSYPAAINYGATATSMAHELIHAFDKPGGWHDGDGNRRSWWSKKTTEEFDKRTQCLVDQYSKMELVSDSNSSLVVGKIDGKTTLMENFADGLGFKLAFEAYQKFMESAKPLPTKPLPEMAVNVLPQQPEMNISVDIQPRPPHSQEPTLSITVDASPMVLSKTDLEKLFYVSYAQSWCSSTHAPHYFRVNGVVMNDRYFGKLFKCPAGEKMNPNNKCTVW